MNWRIAASLVAALLVTACTNHRIEFEELPNGMLWHRWR
jgi:hypothetical protein